MRKVLIAMMLAAMSGSLMAADSAEKLIEQKLKLIDKRIPVASIKPAAIKGMYEVELTSGESLFADSKGEYFVVGNLYKLDSEDGFVNLTEKKVAIKRAERIAAIADTDKVVYKPAGEVKATINVFTDISCPYCRKLHEEVPALNKMGVQVNYLAFPRAGENSAAFREMRSIWCNEPGKARAEAMHASKTGGDVAAKVCDTPVMEQMVLGQQVGVTGTPAMVLEDGTLIPGYVPAARLASMLELN